MDDTPLYQDGLALGSDHLRGRQLLELVGCRWPGISCHTRLTAHKVCAPAQVRHELGQRPKA
jgi:hypothetical protein